MMALEPGQPCPLCAVRPDVACRHRAADPAWQQREIPEADGRKNNGGRQAGRSSGEFAGLNGYRKFTMAADGKTYRIKGRGD